MKILLNRLILLLGLALTVATLVLILVVPCEVLAEPNIAVVTPSGQRVHSIFEGLRRSSYARHVKGHRFDRDSRVQLKGGYPDEGLQAGYLPVQCTQCPSDSVCSGHYEKLVTSTGCVDPYGACPLPLNNAVTDTQTKPYSSGSYDSYCGVHCCLDAQFCTNNNP